MRDLAITGIEHDSITSTIMFGSEWGGRRGRGESVERGEGEAAGAWEARGGRKGGGGRRRAPDERATPPSALMSAGMRSRAITATAPAASAIFACSPLVTSMMTPPFWKTANARFTCERGRGGGVRGPVGGENCWGN